MRQEAKDVMVGVLAAQGIVFAITVVVVVVLAAIADWLAQYPGV